MRNKELLIAKNISIKDALIKLDETAKKTLFVVDDIRKLIGSLSDGDIRRYILKGGELNDAVINASNQTPKFLLESEESKAELFLNDEKISAVPIVSEGMIVKDIICQYDTVDLSVVEIRKLVPSDRDLIIEFFGQMAGDTRAMFNRGNINGIRVLNYIDNGADDEVHYIAIVKEGTKERIVGYVFLYETNKKVPWLGIAVSEQWKGNKLGRILLSYIDEYALKKGYGGILLTTVPANIRAQALYTNMGYEYLGTHPCAEFLYLKRYNDKSRESSNKNAIEHACHTGA